MRERMNRIVIAAAVIMAMTGCGGAESDEAGHGAGHAEAVHPSDTAAMEVGEALVENAADPGTGEYAAPPAPEYYAEGDNAADSESYYGEEGGSDEGGEAVFEEYVEEEGEPGAPEVEPIEEEKVEGEVISVNPFILAEAQQTSTFASDSDSASYDLFRQHAAQGSVLEPERVRLEEFVNAFGYDYFAPEETDESPFELHLGLAESPFTEGAQLLRIGIQGKKSIPGGFPGRNLVFLVDVSGSMGATNKLPLVKEMLKAAVDALEPTDRMSIVTYSGMEKLALANTQVSAKAMILDAIDTLDSGGSTNGEAGIHMAYEQVQAGWIDGGINHVVLCTDGDFNVGVSSTQELISIIEEKREEGTTLTIAGFGAYPNDHMMEMVSNAGNGTYKVVTDVDDAIDYAFSDLIDGMYFIAKDVKIQVEFNPDFIYAHRKLGYENRELEDWMFFEASIDAGEVPLGHAVTAIYELIPVGQSLPEPEGAPALMTDVIEPLGLEILPDEKVRVKIRYKDRLAGKEDESTQMADSIEMDREAVLFEDADSDLRFASSVAAFAEILRGSPFASKENVEFIMEILADTIGDRMDRSQFLDHIEQIQHAL